MRLLKTSHLGPTMVVTTVAYLLAMQLWWEGPALVIAFTVFTGQLCVGWTNDLVDREIDRAEGRTNKPIASGQISVKTVRSATYVALGFCIAFSLFGPLGIQGGAVHLLGVGFGVAYNFYFKKTILSPLPFLIAFSALPSCIVLSKKSTVPVWLLISGALFGLAIHFSNVVKDLEADRTAGIYGAPQKVGIRGSVTIAGLSLIVISLILNSVVNAKMLIAIAIVALILLFTLPRKFTFWVVMAMALIDVGVLVTSGAHSLVLPA